MVVASGIVKVDKTSSAEEMVSELKRRGMEVDDFETEHIIFIIRKETLEDVKREIDSIKNLSDVKNVYITYYSLEGTEREPAEEEETGIED